MYGAGNIGRGFIGAQMSKAGYEVVFIDVDETLVNQLNQKKGYPLREITDEGHRDTLISPIRAIHGRDREAVAADVAGCDLMATAVGARVLPFIAPLIAQGLKQRFQNNKAPLNIIICENLMDAHLVMEGLLKQEMNAREQARFHEDIGLVEASIGRMVPIQTEEMKAGDPLRVCVEPYGFLPVDQAAFKGEIPSMEGLVPYAPFDYYIKRKLFLHNMGHACTAYLGQYFAHDLIAGAIREPVIELAVKAAMTESAAALSLHCHVPIKELLEHRDDLLFRFRNKALGDSCARVGADIPRKLARKDRLTGAMLLCEQQEIQPVFIALGAAAGLYWHMKQTGGQTDARAVFTQLSGLENNDKLVSLVLSFYQMFEQDMPLAAIYEAAVQEKHRLTGPVV